MSAANPGSLLLVFFVLAARHQAFAQGTTTRTVADSCLATSEFQLRGVFLTTDTAGNLAKLGGVLRVTTDSGVDLGGRRIIKEEVDRKRVPPDSDLPGQYLPAA